MMRIRKIEELDSTNTYCRQHISDLAHLEMVSAVRQSAGRGQRGNHWESEPGKNLTFSVVLRPEHFPAREQFYISESVSLAIVDALRELGVEACIKWPNDIYADDRKICGILIEHAVMGSEILYTIAGAGININQRRFLSDAPNPVSVSQLTDREYDLAETERMVAEKIETRLDVIFSGQRSALHEEYMRTLWRADGQMHSFIDASTGEHFEGAIADVEPLGHLVLRMPDGATRRYAFKEVEWRI